MPRIARGIVVPVLLAALLLGVAPPAVAVIPPPLRLALVFQRTPWTEIPDRPGPRPPGHVVTEWSADESS